MKFLSLFALTFAALLLAAAPAPAQTDDSDATQAPLGSTVITSDELHSDQTTHQSVFTGKVIVVGTNFRMTCDEMTVYFTNDNKVDRIVSTGDVIITQPNRVTHCGHAEYFRDEDKFVLTDQPSILDGKNNYASQMITIFRTSQKIEMKGGRTHVTLGPDAMSTPATSPLPTK